ncbi:MAG: hypothetical protein ACNS62_24540 [Candidatus Cyclobacteriaceae bacterium M3_2C_046]
MKVSFHDSQDYLNKLRNRIYILIGIPMVAFVLVYLQMEKEGKVFFDLNSTIHRVVSILLPTLVVVIAGYAFYQYRNQLKQVKDQHGLKRKLEDMFQLIYQMFFLFQIAAMLSIAGLILTGDKIYTLFYVIILFVSSIYNPSWSRISKSLQLNQEEKDILRERKPIE